MKMIGWAGLAGAFCLASLGGCVPLQMRFYNGIDTRIVDRTSGQPIRNARLTLTGHCAGNERTGASVSDASGHVRVEPRSGWIGLALAPIDYFDAPGSLRVEAEGYQPFTATEAGEWTAGSCIARPAVLASGPPEGLPLTRIAGDSAPPR
jgi:hypothetical protein